LATETSSALSSIESNAVSDTSTATVITGTASTTQTLSQGSGVAISLQSLSGLTGTDLKEAIHSLYVEKVTSTSVTVVIASDPLKATISVGQSKKFDLNRDGTSDVEVKLNSVDGKDAETLAANINQRAIILPKGNHLVKFSFEPKSFKTGAFVSMITSFTLLSLILLPLAKKFVLRR